MTRYFLIPPSSCLQVKFLSRSLASLHSSEHHRWIFCFVFLVVDALTVTNTDCWARDEIKIILHASSSFYLFTTTEKSWNHLSRGKETGKFSPAIQSHSVDGITISRLAIGPKADQFSLSLSLASKISRLRQSSRKLGKDAIKMFFFLQNHAVKRESNRSSVFVSLFDWSPIWTDWLIHQFHYWMELSWKQKTIIETDHVIVNEKLGMCASNWFLIEAFW